MLNDTHVPQKYRFMFYEMCENDIFIDGGMNEGKVTDICVKVGAKVYGFEPNPLAHKFLKNKYRNNKNVIVENKAIADKNDIMEFCFNSIFDQGGSIIWGKGKINNYKVDTIDFSEYLKKIESDIYMIKLDIEGAEFDVIENMIKSGIYKKCKYIVCETHERFFKDGDKKMEILHKLISDNNITNIYLDWI
jgi:FkbM family methyltransferase